MTFGLTTAEGAVRFKTTNTQSTSLFPCLECRAFLADRLTRPGATKWRLSAASVPRGCAGCCAPVSETPMTNEDSLQILKNCNRKTDLTNGVAAGRKTCGVRVKSRMFWDKSMPTEVTHQAERARGTDCCRDLRINSAHGMAKHLQREQKPPFKSNEHRRPYAD